MKKIMLSLCALAALVSCAKELDSAFNAVENENAAVAAAGKTIVRAGLAEAQKTYLGPASGDTRPVYWQATDAIQINGVNSTSIEIDPSNPSSATFAIGGVVEYPYHAAYPAALASGFVADSVVINLPAVQNYVEDSFDPKAAAMFAYASEGDLVFKHAMSFLKVKIGGGTNSSAIKSVRVRANMNRTPGSIDWGREPMSGEFVANITSDGVVFHRLLNDASSVTLDCGDGVVQGKELYIAIPAQTYHYGINLFIVSADNQCQEIVSKKAFAAEAGKAYLTEIAYNGGMTYVGAGIYTPGDWDAFAAQCTINDACEEFKDENGEYILRNDLYAESFQRLGGITEGAGKTGGTGSDFKGVLNGNGKSLYPSDQTVPFFTYISGTVKNLTVAGERKSFASTAGWGTCQFALDVLEGGLVDNCVVDFDVIAKPTANAITWYYGMFRNIKAGATVTNCVVKSDYTIDYNGVTTNDVNVLPFSYSNAGTVKDCRNEGNINFVQDPGQKAIVGCIYLNTGSLEGFVNTGNFTIKSAKGAAVAGVAVMGGGSIKNCVNGVEDSSSEYGVIDVTASPTANVLQFRVGGIACYADASSATNCGLFYGDKNYGDITLTKTGTNHLSGSAIGGITCYIRYGAYGSTENNTFAVFDGCENHGHLTVYEPSKTGTQTALYLGGIIGYVINANGLSSGALVLTKPTTTLNGNYVVCRANCINKGTLEMASANSSGMGGVMSGARQNYVGGICGFAYGMGNTNTSGSSNAHYAVIRGQQNGVIKVGSSVTGNSSAGGIIGGGCYVKIDDASVNVTYEATSLKTNNAAPVYRGACAAVAGFMVKHSVIGIDGKNPVNATMENNTGLICSKDISNPAETLSTLDAYLGYAGISGAKSVDNTDKAVVHKLTVYGNPIATLNGVTITEADLYGSGTKSIDQN